MKANGGVFVVDDFGRQRIRPRDLLNRWIVPLESRVDFLTLHTGKKFEMPFDVLIVFATNLNPESLADEAFLRRIPYKIYAKNPTAGGVRPDLRAELQAQGHRVRPGHRRVPACAATTSRAGSRCAPAIRATSSSRSSTSAATRTEPLVITRELLDQACRNYFLEEQASTRSAPGARGRARPAAPPRPRAEARPRSGMAVLSRAVAVPVARSRHEARRAACASARPSSPPARPSAACSSCSPSDRRRVRADGPPHRAAAARQRDCWWCVLTVVRRPAVVVDRAWRRASSRRSRWSASRSCGPIGDGARAGRGARRCVSARGTAA